MILFEVDQLAFETAEEVFCHGVVVRITPARHALADAIGLQAFAVGPGRILHAPVAVENEALWRYAMSSAARVS